MKITQAQGNGQVQCALCKKRGKWNVQWMCFLYKVEGKEGVYCSNCVDEIKIQNAIDSRIGSKNNYENERKTPSFSYGDISD